MNTIIGFGNIKKGNALNGISFGDGKRTLFFRGKSVAVGVLPDNLRPHDYFYELRFLEDFPEVSLWAFGDAWTQRILVERPSWRDGDKLFGFVRFGNNDESGQYVIERKYNPYPPEARSPGAQIFPPLIYAPLPPRFDVSANIPLRLVVARAVLSALDDNWPYNQWIAVTSVLAREEVPYILTQDVALSFGFQLQGYATDLRQALCDAQGI